MSFALPDEGDVPKCRPQNAHGRTPDAELAVVPGTSHGLLVEKPDLCNLLIADFLTKDPVQTFAPIRRDR
jgi:pimeloyl-ACP methyl ester carboxylesterase